jgi:DNA-binding MarR family transcriptional regulator
MNQAKYFAVLTLLFFASVSTAAPPAIPEGDYIISIYAQDLATSQYLVNKTVQVYSRQSDSQTYTMISERTRYDGSLTTYLDKGAWKVLADIDYSNTPGKDLVALNMLNISKDSNFTMVFQEVGSVYGDVLYTDGSTVRDGDVEIDCVSSAYAPDELNEEKNLKIEGGAFIIKYIPIGACRLTVSNGISSKTVDIVLKQGELKNLSITLRKPSLFEDPFTLGAILLIAMILTAVSYLIIRYRSKTEETPDKVSAPHEPLSKTKKVLDVMKTLNQKESAIVELLLENEGRMKQSKIYAKLLVPKTTLSRTIRGLEARNILRLKPMGKTNLIELTDWFKS